MHRTEPNTGFDSAAFHRSVCRAFQMFLGLDGDFEVLTNIPANPVDAWNMLFVTVGTGQIKRQHILMVPTRSPSASPLTLHDDLILRLRNLPIGTCRFGKRFAVLTYWQVSRQRWSRWPTLHILCKNLETGQEICGLISADNPRLAPYFSEDAHMRFCERGHHHNMFR